MEIVFFFLSEGRFYDFVAYFLGFFFFYYGSVDVGLLQSVDFLENSWLPSFAAYYCSELWLFESVKCFCVLFFLR
jgi:hypothetical protein